MEMTGTTNPDRRAELWEMPDKRLYFMTPGTLKNDLAKGTWLLPGHTFRDLPPAEPAHAGFNHV